MTTLTAPLLDDTVVAELDRLGIEYDVVDGVIHLYRTQDRTDDPQPRAEARAFLACCKAAPGGCHWHPWRRPG